MSLLRLLGLVTATGHARVSLSEPAREATLTLYHEGAEVGTIEIDVPGRPEIGDKYDININRRTT